jgi:oligosaccharide repeat unit polymerase
VETTLNVHASHRQRRFCQLAIFLSLLVLLLGETISHLLGLYGSVVLVWVVCAAVVRPIRFSASRFDLAHVLLFFVLHYFLMFGLYGFMNAFGLSHYLGVSYDTGQDSPERLSALASVYAAGVLLAIYAGFVWQSKSSQRERAAQTASSTMSFEALERLQTFAVICLGIALVGCALMIYFLGGLRVIGIDPAYVSTAGSHGLYWAESLISTNQWALIVNLFSYVVLKRSKYLILACLSLPVFVVDFLLSGSKSAVILPVIGFFIVRHYCHSRINWRALALVGAVVLVVFAAGYTYRATGAELSQFGQGMASYSQSPLALFQTFVGRFYGTDSFVMVLDSVRRGQPLLMGRSLDTLLTWFIPRWLWPSKPVSFGLKFGELMMSSAPTAGDEYYAPSLPGELYLNFGVAGLFLGGLAFGWLLRYIYRTLIERSPLRVEAVVLYATVAPLVAEVDEGLGSGLEFILTRVILYVLLMWVAGVLNAPLSRQPSLTKSSA